MLGEERTLHDHELLNIQEKLARFLVQDVLNHEGKFYDPQNFDETYWTEQQQAVDAAKALNPKK